MKIGILTLPLGINYGGILQTWALQTVLQNMGHDIVVLNRGYGFPSVVLLIRRILSCGKCLYRKYFLHDKAVRINSVFASHYYTYYYDDSDLKAFIKKYIYMTNEIRTSKNLYFYVRKYGLDAVIVGSDQVWRETYVPDISDYFLGFIPKKYEMKRIAYAASFGTDKCVYSSKTLKRCKDLAARFDAISVRENSGCQIFHTTFSMNVPVVVDPTLLLTTEDYESLISQEKKSGNGVTLVHYILDANDSKRKIVSDIVTSYSLKSVSLSISPRKADGRLGKLDSVATWLSDFLNAKFIVTDSFHGCVFSILFNKPFIAIANKNRGLSRFTTLLGSFNLQDRLVFSYEEYMNRKGQLLKPMDYKPVNQRLYELRKESRDFLFDALTTEKTNPFLVSQMDVM